MRKVIIVVMLAPVFAYGQKHGVSFKKWSTIGSVGLVTGESGSRPVFQLSSGINYRQFFTGVGLGYDSYEFNSMPVFADLRYKFGQKVSGFIYGMAGYNFPFMSGKSVENFKTSENRSGGLFLDLGVGCRIPMGKVDRLLLSAGFSQKKMSQRQTFNYPCFTGNCEEATFNYDYNFGRITAKLSWELGY